MPDALGTLPLTQGFILGTSLCFSLGPQSLFVLRRGISRTGALRIATVCTAADLVMIALAICTASTLALSQPGAARLGALGGAAFALIFGIATLLSCWRSGASRPLQPSPRAGIAAALALSFLNPQVYGEMIALVGGFALQFEPPERTEFALGVAAVSPLWFFGLALGGRNLAPLLARPRALLALDAGTGLVMVGIAVAIFARECSAA
jgi:L-lysine exporter family protein LysE/ArgO